MVAAKHAGLTLARMKELIKNRSDAFTLEELIMIVARLGYSVKLKIKKSDLKHPKLKARKLPFKSDAFEAIHSSASALYKIGAIDKAAMRGFDPSASRKTPLQNLLTPPPKELKKALALSAKQARTLAAAYGVKVPYAKTKAT